MWIDLITGIMLGLFVSFIVLSIYVVRVKEDALDKILQILKRRREQG